MDLYIERENGSITLEEWLDYVKSDGELTLSETAEATNPITKSVLRVHIKGRALWRSYEIIYRKGRIGSEDGSEELAEKLKQIASALSAEVFDCGEKIK